MREADIRPLELFDRFLELARNDIARFFGEGTPRQDIPCPGCGSPDRDFCFAKFDFSYQACTSCGSLYVTPRPSREAFARFYLDSEAVRFWSTDFFPQTAEARRERMFRPRAELVRDLIRARPDLEPDVFVDIGAGYGIMLEELRAQQLFQQIVAVEPGQKLAGVCRDRGFEVEEVMAEDIRADRLRAAVASAFEVLEHVYAPIDFLRGVGRALRPGGLCLCTTLTVSGFDLQVLWEHSKSICPPNHINLLSVDGLRQLAERAGFRIVELCTPGQLDVDIVRNAMKQDDRLEVPRFVSYLIERCDSSAQDAFQRFLQNNNLSSHVRLVLEKVA